MVKPASGRAHESSLREDEKICAPAAGVGARTRRCNQQACLAIALCCIHPASGSPLVGFDAGSIHQFAGGLGFNADEVVKSRRRHGHGRGANHVQPIFEILIG